MFLGKNRDSLPVTYATFRNVYDNLMLSLLLEGVMFV